MNTSCRLATCRRPAFPPTLSAPNSPLVPLTSNRQSRLPHQPAHPYPPLQLGVSAPSHPHFIENSLTQRDLAVFQKQLSSKARTTQRTVGQLLLERLSLQLVVRLRHEANERDFEPPSESPEKPEFRPPGSPKRLHTSAYGFLLR